MLAKQVQLINDEQTDLGQPTPMTAPVARASVEAFGRHHEQLSPFEGNRIVLSAAVFACEYTDLKFFESLLPSFNQLVSESAQWRDVNSSSSGEKCR